MWTESAAQLHRVLLAPDTGFSPVSPNTHHEQSTQTLSFYLSYNYTVSQKKNWARILCLITLTNVDQFQSFFHCHITRWTAEKDDIRYDDSHDDANDDIW